MTRTIVTYNPKLKEIAKKLRKSMTLSEVILWNHLKQKQIYGYDFDRQRPIEKFIVDFYCKELKLAIEIDGVSHDGERAWKKDQNRQERLERLGIRFLRFHDKDVKNNLQAVLRSIEGWVLKNVHSVSSDRSSHLE